MTTKQMVKKITSLKRQKKNRERINIYLDDQFAFGVARIVGAWLEVGQELSEDKIAALKAADSLETAYKRALNFLSYRERSEFEVRKNLQKHQTPQELIDEVVARLERNGLLNDHQFAARWIENRATFRPRSRLALAHELRLKGISQAIIDQSLEGFSDQAAAYQAANKYVRKLRELEWPIFQRKLLGFLARRGFGYATAKPVVERVWSELNTE